MLKRLATCASAVLVFSAMQLSASLPARAQTCFEDTVGSWELFVQYDYPDVVAFTGSPSYYVSGEQDYPGPDKNLPRARAKSLGPWEYWVFQRIF
jgi:hypothetical protein